MGVAGTGTAGAHEDVGGGVIFAAVLDRAETSMKVKDPICGMTVDTERAAAKGSYDGQMVYFCSVSCQKTFESRRGGAAAGKGA